MMRNLLLILLISLPSIVFGEDISGTGWFFERSNGDKQIILFEKDGTFTFLDVVISSNVDGLVYSKQNQTYSVNEDLVVISFSDGYNLCSLTINNRKDRMSGTCINKRGLVVKKNGRLIE